MSQNTEIVRHMSQKRTKRTFLPVKRRSPRLVNKNEPGGFPTGLANPTGAVYEPGRIIWKFATTPISLEFNGGAIAGSARLVLLFWGDFWETAVSPSVSDIHQAVADILNSPYLSEMMQYGFRWLTLDPPLIVLKPDPPSPTFSRDDAKNMVWALIDDERFPEPDDDSGDGRIVYMVLAPQGSNYEDLSAGGAHGDAEDRDFLDVDHAWVGWVDFDSSLDRITEVLTHELVEILSDPEPTSGWQVTSPEGWMRSLTRA